jgi:hypothetical protein
MEEKMWKMMALMIPTVVVLLGIILVFAIAIGIPGCIVEDDDDPEPGGDTDTDADADADSDTDADITYDTIEFCSVTIQFAFSGDTAYEAVMTNYNAATVLVAIDNETTGGLVAENCLWPIGSWGDGNGGDEDVATVNFQKSDMLTITIQIGEGDFLQRTCIGSIDDLFEVFPLCDSQTY